jgi:hypothetical protein
MLIGGHHAEVLQRLAEHGRLGAVHFLAGFQLSMEGAVRLAEVSQPMVILPSSPRATARRPSCGCSFSPNSAACL